MQKEFKPTPEMISRAELVFLAMAHSQTIRATIYDAKENGNPPSIANQRKYAESIRMEATAKELFIDEMESISHICYEQLKHKPELFSNYVELSLRLMAPFMDSTKILNDLNPAKCPTK